MALVLNSNVVIAVLFGMMILSCVFLVASIVVAFFNPRKGYGWLRCSICAAGVIFSPVMSFFLYVAVTFWREGQPFTGSELSELQVAMAILAIPMVVGLLAAVGTRNRLVRRVGNILVFAISPAVLLLVIAGAAGGTIETFLPWAGTAIVTCMIAWAVLLMAGREETIPAGEPVRLNDA